VVAIEGGLFIRPVFAAARFAAIRCLDTPAMASIRPGVFTAGRAPPSSDLPLTTAGRMELLEVRRKEESIDFRDKELLIAAGAGAAKLFQKEKKEELKNLAEQLNGAIAASRKLVDAGIAPRSVQVGQSGKTVSPRFYLALGIHGSAQHIAGLRNVGRIVAVNTNPDAPLCSIADLTVESDAGEFVQALRKLLIGTPSRPGAAD